MARKTTRQAPGPASRPDTASTETSDHDRVVAALMALLAEKPFDQVGMAEIAVRADISLSDLRALFASTLAILAAHMKAIDRAVLAGIDADLAEEPPRERLFDVLMRRLDLHEPHREAVRSLVRSATFNPAFACVLNGLALRSMQWMLTAADISAAGPRGMIRAQGLVGLYLPVLRTWLDDNDPGHARTMAELDRALARGQRWSGFLDDLYAIPSGLFGGRARRRRDDTGGDTVTA